MKKKIMNVFYVALVVVMASCSGNVSVSSSDGGGASLDKPVSHLELKEIYKGDGFVFGQNTNKNLDGKEVTVKGDFNSYYTKLNDGENFLVIEFEDPKSESVFKKTAMCKFDIKHEAKIKELIKGKKISIKGKILKLAFGAIIIENCSLI